jgi:uncharacterized membrane protein
MCPTKREGSLERWVHWTLLAGAVLAGALALLGLAIVFVRHEFLPDGPPSSLGALIRGALVGDGTSIIDLGLLVLMATPLARVAILAIGWTLEGRRRFAVVALVVLALLSLSLVLGIG